VQSEARHLIAAGHQVVVVAPGPRLLPHGPGEPRVRAAGGGSLFGAPGALLRLRQHPLRAFGGVQFAYRARRELLRAGPLDRVIAHFIVPCALPIGIGTATMVEAVGHGSDVRLLLGLPGPVRRRLAHALVRGTSGIRLVSEELREQWIDATFPAMREHCYVRASPIDLGTCPTRSEARRRRGIGPREQVALVVARLIPSKRVGTALRALQALPAVRTVVVGGGPLASQLSSEFPKVRFEGALDRPTTLEWIAAADVLVSASIREGAPTSVREARALRVPVVTCEAGDVLHWAARDPDLWVIPAPA
jgi:glycosyltransferase involved in cell wall biosynthesis